MTDPQRAIEAEVLFFWSRLKRNSTLEELEHRAAATDPAQRASIPEERLAKYGVSRPD